MIIHLLIIWCRRCRRYVAIDGANRDAPQVRDDPVDDVAERGA